MTSYVLGRHICVLRDVLLKGKGFNLVSPFSFSPPIFYFARSLPLYPPSHRFDFIFCPSSTYLSTYFSREVITHILLIRSIRCNTSLGNICYLITIPSPHYMATSSAVPAQLFAELCSKTPQGEKT